MREVFVQQPLHTGGSGREVCTALQELLYTLLVIGDVASGCGQGLRVGKGTRAQPRGELKLQPFQSRENAVSSHIHSLPFRSYTCLVWCFQCSLSQLQGLRPIAVVSQGLLLCQLRDCQSSLDASR